MNSTSGLPLPVARRAYAVVLLTTTVAVAATDLVLPAIPALPRELGGSIEAAQLVLAAFVAGFAAGLLAFGELGARVPQQAVLGFSLILFAAFSGAAALATSIDALVTLRLAQGFFAAAGAAYSPGIIRRLFAEPAALRAIGLQGSVESLMPALAPIVGAWLVSVGTWRTSFGLLASGAALSAIAVLTLPSAVFPEPRRVAGSYVGLLRSIDVVRHGLAQALSLGSILVFVFAMPTVMVEVWGGSIQDFITMQVGGVTAFIVATLLAPAVCRHIDEEQTVLVGSIVCAGGFTVLLAYALVGGRSIAVVTILAVVANAGFGLRGPPGLLRTLTAAQGDDSRASALVVFATLTFVAVGTLAVAPAIRIGMGLPALAASVMAWGSVGVLVALGRLSKRSLKRKK